MRYCIAALSAVVLLAGCVPQYVVPPSTLDPAFDTGRQYKVAVMPFLVRGLLTPDAFQRDMAYQYLVSRMMSTGKLMPISQPEVERAVRLHEFGQGGTVDPAMARQIGKELGADLVCLAELVFDQELPKVVLNASVRIVSPDTPTDIYYGVGKAVNVASTGIAAQTALDMAVETLLRKMK
jgi:hypothetical protein